MMPPSLPAALEMSRIISPPGGPPCSLGPLPSAHQDGLLAQTLPSRQVPDPDPALSCNELAPNPSGYSYYELYVYVLQVAVMVAVAMSVVVSLDRIMHFVRMRGLCRA